MDTQIGLRGGGKSAHDCTSPLLPPAVASPLPAGLPAGELCTPVVEPISILAMRNTASRCLGYSRGQQLTRDDNSEHKPTTLLAVHNPAGVASTCDIRGSNLPAPLIIEV